MRCILVKNDVTTAQISTNITTVIVFEKVSLVKNDVGSADNIASITNVMVSVPDTHDTLDIKIWANEEIQLHDNPIIIDLKLGNDNWGITSAYELKQLRL